MLTGHDESTNQSQLQQGLPLLKLGERVVNMDEDLESIGSPSIYSLGLVRLPHLGTPAQFQFKHHSSNKFIQNTPQQLEKRAEHDEHSSNFNMTPQKKNTYLKKTQPSLISTHPSPFYSPTNPPPRSSTEEIPPVRVHPLSSLSGAEELKVAPPRFRTDPEFTHCLHVWSKRCEIFSDFKLSTTKININNKCVLLIQVAKLFI